MPGIIASYEAVIAPSNAAVPRNAAPVAVELKDGRLLLAWVEYYGGTSDFNAARIAALNSADAGRTWQDKFILQENIGETNVGTPNLLRLQNGDLAFAYSVKNSAADCRIFLRRSADEGQTWSDPVRVTPETTAYYTIHNDRLLQHSSGRLLAPIASMPEWSRESSMASYCCWSNDGGRTWERGPNEISLPMRGALEPVLVERRDASLLMLMRTELGDQYRAESADRGESWTDIRPLGVVSSDAPAMVKRIPATGDLLLVWNHCYDPNRRHFGRTPLTAAISRDDGETWENFRDIESDPQRYFGYPALLFNGHEVLIFYWSTPAETGNWDLKVKIYPVNWFFD